MRHSEPSQAGQNKLSAADQLEGISRKERQSIEEQSRPSAALIHETIRAEGEKLDRASSALLLSGFAAGLGMGFSLIAEGLLRSHLPETLWRELVTPLGYSVGFVIVVLGRQQLFTENTLTPILPLLYRRSAETLWHVTRLWAVVLLSNIAATWVIAAVLAHGPVFEPQVKEAFAQISRESIAHPFGTTVLKGIFAGWLIALMVWLLPAAEAARLWIIILLTYLVSLGGFAHIVAGSVDAAYLVITGEASLGDYILRFFMPTLIGNVLGGVALVAVLNYGQVATEIRE
jgi:formate-nitrite transporter family protein